MPFAQRRSLISQIRRRWSDTIAVRTTGEPHLDHIDCNNRTIYHDVPRLSRFFPAQPLPSTYFSVSLSSAFAATHRCYLHPSILHVSCQARRSTYHPMAPTMHQFAFLAQFAPSSYLQEVLISSLEPLQCQEFYPALHFQHRVVPGPQVSDSG